VTKTSSPESPPQKIEKRTPYDYDPPYTESLKKRGGPPREYTQEEADEAQEAIEKENIRLTRRACSHPPQGNDDLRAALGAINKAVKSLPAEEVELTNLKKYILEDGFVLSTVAFHIRTLCAEPLTTPSTTTWDFVDRALVPDMVFALLNQPGYLEGIWPSLRIVMGSNKGNSAWTAGIATTIAFFDTIRVLPSLKELKNEKQ